jgi:hypothetical protein
MAQQKDLDLFVSSPPSWRRRLSIGVTVALLLVVVGIVMGCLQMTRCSNRCKAIGFDTYETPGATGCVCTTIVRTVPPELP